MSKKRWIQLGLLVPVGLLAAGLAAPYVRADRYGEDIRNGLQNALGRKVEILDKVTFNLFTGPGFTINKVVVYDDASAGIEPFALVDQLEARVRLTSLLFGNLEFSKVRLVDPYVNLVKREGSPWNVVPLLRRAPAKGTVSLPEIEVSGGRFNFKFGDTKSPFYLSNADVTIARSSKPGEYQIRFYGEPARTDRSARGFGSLRGRGKWTSGLQSALDLDIELERSGVDEIATLIRGDAVGVHGVASAKLKVAGPVSHLGIEGLVRMEDIHRWDLLQSKSGGGWNVNVRGSFDLDQQRLDLAAAPEFNPGLPFSARLSLMSLLSVPVIESSVEVKDLPATTMIEVARHMGAPLPVGLDVEGNVSGAVAYAEPAGFAGHLEMANAGLRIGGGSLLRVANASLQLSGGEVHLLPSTLIGDNGQEASVEATYFPATAAVEATVTGKGLRIADLQGGLLGGRALPMADRFAGGLWSGSLQYRQPPATEGKWSGTFHVRDTITQVAGLAEPVKFAVARVDVAGDQLVIRGFRAHIGTLECFGEYTHDGLQNPQLFDISVPKADIAELERIFRPTLAPDSSFLSRTLRLRQAPAPDWLRGVRANGIVRIGALTGGDSVLRGVRSNVSWTGSTVQFQKLTAKFNEGSLTGNATIKAGGREPEYQLRGNLLNVSWHGGKLDVSGLMTTIGSGTDLLLNLTSSGTFQGKALNFSPEYLFRSASGSYELAVNRTGPQAKVTVLQAAIGAERFSGEGSTQPDGKLVIDLASPGRSIRLEVMTK